MNVRMKRVLALLIVSVFAFIAVTPAEAVIGRGRSSSGSRGSRGFGTPSRGYSAPAPSRPNYGNSAQQPYRTAPPAPPAGGGFLRNLGAGVAGGFLGSMLFRGLGGGGGGSMEAGAGGGGGGIGLLELLLLAGVAFFAYRWFMARKQSQFASTAGPTGYRDYGSNYSPTPELVATPPMSSEESPQEVLETTEVAFDEGKFRDARLDDFFKLQAAFGNRDLTPVRNLLASELLPTVEEDVAELRRTGQVNRMDNIAVRQVQLTEAWREPGRVYATVRFEANVIDYTVDEKTNQVVSGSKTETTKFNEAWTFVREVGFGKGDAAAWRLSAIERSA